MSGDLKNNYSKKNYHVKQQNLADNNEENLNV